MNIGRIKLFKVENDLLVLDKEEIRGIEEFKVILERDKGSKGDNDGRKKFAAYKQFMYIYIVADLNSYPNQAAYNDKELHEAGIIEARLESNFKPDAAIKIAIAKYRKIQLEGSPTLNALHTSIRGLRLSDMNNKRIINNIESAIERHEKSKKEKEERGEPIDLASELVLSQSITSQLDLMMATSVKIPKMVSILEELFERLRKEEKGDNFTRGGHVKGNRADPK